MGFALKQLAPFPTDCGGCFGACCRNVLGLIPARTDREIEALRHNPAPTKRHELELHLRANPIPEFGTCIWQDGVGRCATHGEEGELLPEACRKFLGTPGCLEVRKDHGR